MTISEEGRALREAAAVEPAGSGRDSVNISPYYTIAGHPHGGYLQCIMANAALAGASEEGASHLHTTAITTRKRRAAVRAAWRDLGLLHRDHLQSHRAHQPRITLVTGSEVMG